MDKRNLILKIEGPSINKGKIPFSLLANILKGVQETIYFIALSELRREVRKRARIPLDIQRSCELIRVLESPGSYEILATIPEPEQTTVFEVSDIGLVAKDKFLDIVETISSGSDTKRLSEIIPDGNHRKRILRSIESFSPRPGYEWSLLVGGGKAFSYINNKTRQNISKLLIEPTIEKRTVTGELIRLHLDENSLGIFYPPTKRVLDCYYDPDLEDVIIQNLKGFIQVTGTVQLDSNGHPNKIVDVFEIEELDLSPARFTKISADKVVLSLKEPIEITPYFEDQAVVFEYPKLNIISSGATRDEAVTELQSDIYWLWKEYVEEDDDNLTNDAIELKKYLKDIVVEVYYES